MVTRTAVGTKATVKVLRDGHEKELILKVGEQPDTIKMAKADTNADESVALAGIEVQAMDKKTARELGLSEKAKGVVVTNIDPESPAGDSGLREGDVIQEINRQEIKSVKDFEKIASGLKKDQPALLLINRRGASLFLTVKV